MDFSEALHHLKAGQHITRTGWNGKGMWLAIEDTTRWATSTMRPFIYMRTADGQMVPWVASQTDLLAHDWDISSPGNAQPPATPPSANLPTGESVGFPGEVTLTVHARAAQNYALRNGTTGLA